MSRLIDGDALLARYKERCAGCKETKNYCEHCCDIADVIDDIEDAPTVDVVERKKGKWIKRGRIFQCSECKKFSISQDNFCSNCGSDNREEKNDVGSKV